eukprot:10689398-Ditylum_brightwellii.AAC.1
MRRKRSTDDVTSVALISLVSHGGIRMVLWRASSVHGTALGPVVGGFALTLSSMSMSWRYARPGTLLSFTPKSTV